MSLPFEVFSRENMIIEMQNRMTFQKPWAETEPGKFDDEVTATVQ